MHPSSPDDPAAGGTPAHGGPGGLPALARLGQALVALTLVLGLFVGARRFGAAASDAGPAGRARSAWTQPTWLAWPAEARWDERAEDDFAAFVARLGEAVARRRCGRLSACLHLPEANTLFDPALDPQLTLDVDCGDLPYALRAYFAFKRRLPFGFVCDVDGVGRDVRYLAQVRPVEWCTWRQFPTPRAVFRGIGERVHSGMYRMAPETEDGDFYPVAVTRDAVPPGTVYYDPDGHVLVVASVESDGVVHLIDAHPDGTLTWKRFGESFALGGRAQGGGFKRFRPQRLAGDRVLRAGREELPLLDDRAQWDRAGWQVGGQPATYHAWVRASLGGAAAPPDPARELREQLRALCRDVAERAEAVELAVEAGLPRRPHPGELPRNIYGAEGDWETYSTPARDARLRSAFRELRGVAAALPPGSPLRAVLREVWQEEAAAPACRFGYTGSTGARVELGLDDVLDRLFDLSFDPYHCPELRWGAPAGSAEAAACPADAAKARWYALERRLRNRLERAQEVPTPPEAGPDEPPDLDVRPLLGIELGRPAP